MDTRKLDALLARHLYNLDAAERDCYVAYECAMNNVRQRVIYDSSCRNHPRTRLWVVPGGPGDYLEVDYYSTTWGGMGRVIEAMRGRGLLSIELHWVDDEWDCELWMTNGFDGWGHAPAISLAVALAAAYAVAPKELEALEVEG